MKKEDFYFELPPELIAQKPLANRCDSRLLVYEKVNQSHCDRQFIELLDYLNPGDLLVFNDTKVIPARLYGKKESGGRVELLIERLLDETQSLCHIKASKAPKEHALLLIDERFSIQVTGRNETGLFYCRLMPDEQGVAITWEQVLKQSGHIPLPPYIERRDEDFDVARYQTVYARYEGSVAAPTAGLHFDQDLLRKIETKGVLIDFVTLHVGAGTFQPVRVDDVTQHHMHYEYAEVKQSLCDRIIQTKRCGNKVIAVGTTAVRSLETAVRNGESAAFSGQTNIFIYPGYQFKVCDGMVTNFHLPESSLIMLVCAFIGHEQALKLYRHAIEKKYRFFSYGDACLLLDGNG